MTNTISHKTTQISDTDATAALVRQIEERLKSADQLMLPLDRTLDLLQQLQQFELGRFLLHNRGLNGYWTAYIFQYAFGKEPETDLERWLLHNSLLVRARERFQRFKLEIGKHLREGVHLASIPCGLMDDLLQLDYGGLERFRLTGVDVDAESVRLAGENARKRGLEAHCRFLEGNAWELAIEDELDVISSNGLNMYEPDPQRLIELYRNFHTALKDGGYLILSFLPPPPADQAGTDVWQVFDIPEEDWKIERALFGDIIQVNYLNFSTEDETRAQLEAAGFTVERVSYNARGVLPIAIARK